MNVSALSRKYARALLESALGKKCEEAVLKDLKLIDSILQDNPDLIKAMIDPGATLSRKKDLLAAILKKLKLHTFTNNCLELLLENGRFARLPELPAGYRQELDRHRGIVEVEVHLKSPLSKTQGTRLENVMKKITGKQIRMTTSERPEILGGLIVKVGSQVYDGSLTSQLQRIRQDMLGE